MKKNNFLAFTLIELLVSMTIFFVVVMVTYIPYNYYQNKAKLRQSIKEIAQSLYEARNLAINGTSSGSNLSIGLYFDTSYSFKDTINFISYPYSFTGSQITRDIGSEINLFKTLKLQPGIEINYINGETNGLFFFESITGNLSYYYWDENGIKNNVSSDEISIEFSYKNSSSTSLKKKIIYYIKTNIVDY